jgi:trigger factor
LAESKKQEADQKLRDTLVEKATENSEIDLPEIMVENELENMMREFEQRLQMQGMNLDLFYQFSGQDEEDLRAQMKEDAEKRVRMGLTLEAIAKAENLEATEEDVNNELQKMADMYNMSVEDIKKAFGGNVNHIKNDLKIQKAIEFLVENSKTGA